MTWKALSGAPRPWTRIDFPELLKKYSRYFSQAIEKALWSAYNEYINLRRVYEKELDFCYLEHRYAVFVGFPACARQ
jgi:hypothetical protein